MFSGSAVPITPSTRGLPLADCPTALVPPNEVLPGWSCLHHQSAKCWCMRVYDICASQWYGARALENSSRKCQPPAFGVFSALSSSKTDDASDEFHTTKYGLVSRMRPSIS